MAYGRLFPLGGVPGWGALQVDFEGGADFDRRPGLRPGWKTRQLELGEKTRLAQSNRKGKSEKTTAEREEDNKRDPWLASCLDDSACLRRPLPLLSADCGNQPVPSPEAKETLRPVCCRKCLAIRVLLRYGLPFF